MTQTKSIWQNGAYDSLKKLPSDTGELETVPHKDRVGSASHLREDIGSKITGRADHVRISHPECTPLNVPVSTLPSLKAMSPLTAMPNKRVQMKAPTKPSTVFLGLNLIRGVLPKSLPTSKCAHISNWDNKVKDRTRTANVGHNIVTDDQGRRDEEPHQTFENVVHDEMAIRDHVSYLEKDHENQDIPRHHNEQE